MNLPGDKKRLLDDVVNELKHIEGVKAVVLGGSYAVGMATESSDLDIALYYSEHNPFDIEAVKVVAAKIAADEPPTVTGFYEWGPWVNGGAWIKADNGEVDFLYKNIEQVRRTIDNSKKGIWENDYEQQPPYGFSSVTFLAEVQCCFPLYDPFDIVRDLKDEVKVYPKILKNAIVQQSLWSAAFTIWQTEKFAAKIDTFNTIGCFTRAVKSIITALFALNELYPLGDKRALDILEQARIKPDRLSFKIDNILCCQKDTLIYNAGLLKMLFEETVALADGLYKPYYVL